MGALVDTRCAAVADVAVFPGRLRAELAVWVGAMRTPNSMVMAIKSATSFALMSFLLRLQMALRETTRNLKGGSRTPGMTDPSQSHRR